MTFNYNTPRKRCQDLDQLGREEGMVKGYLLVEHLGLRERGQGGKEEDKGVWEPEKEHVASCPGPYLL